MLKPDNTTNRNSTLNINTVFQQSFLNIKIPWRQQVLELLLYIFLSWSSVSTTLKYHPDVHDPADFG